MIKINISPKNAEIVRNAYIVTENDSAKKYGYTKSITATENRLNYVYNIDFLDGIRPLYVLTIRDRNDKYIIVFEHYTPESIEIRNAEVYKNGTVYPRREEAPRLLKKYRFMACLVHGLITNGETAPQVQEQPEPTAMEETPTEEEKPAEKPQNAPAEEKTAPKPSKVCYNIVIYTTPDGIKRADIRNARTNSTFMDIPAADLAALKADISKHNSSALFNIIDYTTAETTANNTHKNSPKQPRKDEQPNKYPPTEQNATTGKIDAIQSERPRTNAVDSFVDFRRKMRRIISKNHFVASHYRKSGSFAPKLKSG